MSKSKTILVTGATGTIGAYVALYLKARGFSVIASGRRKSDNDFFSEHNINYVPINLADKKDLSRLEDLNIDSIVHMGGVMPAAMEGYHPEQYVNSIINGTLNLLEFMRKKKVSRIVFGQSRADSNYLMESSSDPIPSDIEKKYPQTGDHAVYAICKNAAVDLIDHYYFQYGIKRFILRLPTIYAYHPNPYFYVNGIKKTVAYKLLINKAIQGEKVEIWGDPARTKEITSIKDLCQVIELSLNSELDGGMYNVGRGVGVTLEEQIKGIVEVFSGEKQSEIVYRPDMPNARQFVHDISKTQKELGYNPEYNYRRLLEDYKEEMERQRFRKLWGSEEDYEEE